MIRNLLIPVLFIINFAAATAQSGVDSLLLVLDEKIRNRDIYVQQKEQKIAELKVARRQVKKASEKLYTINNALYQEYNNYSSDSAIYYLNANIEIALALKDAYKVNETHILSALLFVRLGMYQEAQELLESVQQSVLDQEQQLNFYLAYRELYVGLGLYSQNSRGRHGYWEKTKIYDNNVKRITKEDSEAYMRSTEKALRLGNKYAAALEVNDQRLKLVAPYTPTYALVTFHRSLIYRKMGDIEKEQKYLTLSAISDVQLAIRDNASIVILADILVKHGDVDRAYRYIRFALDNIKDYNTRIRSSDVLNIQTIIDKAYQAKNEKKNRELRIVLLVVCILSILLAISVVYVYKQMKKSVIFSRKLKEINQELESLNSRLHDMNNELKMRNLEVAEANHIKEEYIAYFLDECSKYIDKLDNYRKMVNKKLQDRQYDNLNKITRDNSLKEKESKELFVNFDTMFVNLFPNFLAHFNALLLDEERIVLKKEEVLNPEIRIYALIRLGISDSTKIANFLGYSVNTIYNYRTKMKNKAKAAREDFEWQVKQIGTFK